MYDLSKCIYRAIYTACIYIYRHLSYINLVVRSLRCLSVNLWLRNVLSRHNGVHLFQHLDLSKTAPNHLSLSNYLSIYLSKCAIAPSTACIFLSIYRNYSQIDRSIDSEVFFLSIYRSMEMCYRAINLSCTFSTILNLSKSGPRMVCFVKKHFWSLEMCYRTYLFIYLCYLSISTSKSGPNAWGVL